MLTLVVGEFQTFELTAGAVIEEIMVSPLPNWVIVCGYVGGGLIRGLIVGLVVTTLEDPFIGALVQAIEKVGCRDEHLPEFAVHLGGARTGARTGDRPGGEPGSGRPCAQRPFWLMPEPQPLRLSGGQLYWHGPLALLYGPERIEDNWWQGAVSRDYYIAGDRGGQQYWVYCDRLAHRWYIHGVFPCTG